VHVAKSRFCTFTSQQVGGKLGRSKRRKSIEHTKPSTIIHPQPSNNRNKRTYPASDQRQSIPENMSAPAPNGANTAAAPAANDARDPSGFLSEIIGAPVTVKLNSGVVYKGVYLLLFLFYQTPSFHSDRSHASTDT
jgi:hypothetical protein